jgi:uncharacterized lipoprotein NlpE involved in copper resistance
VAEGIRRSISHNGPAFYGNRLLIHPTNDRNLTKEITMKKLILTLALAVAMLGGCTTVKEKQAVADANSIGQKEFVKTVADNKKPVCELKAIKGQALSITGLESFSCYSSDPAPVWQPSAVAQSDGIEALKVIVGGGREGNDSLGACSPWASSVSSRR